MDLAGRRPRNVRVNLRPLGSFGGVGSFGRIGFLTAAIAFSALTLAPREAHAGGRIVVSDAEFGSYGSEKELNSALKKQARTTFKGDGAWTLNLMVFLRRARGRQPDQHRLL